jgi:hypothetical protein
LHDTKGNDGSLLAQGCGHGDGDDDLSGVMPERSDDDGDGQELAHGACHGGAGLSPTSICGAGYHGGEDLECVSAGHSHRRRHLCMMVMVMTMVMVVMRARSISIVVVVRARRVMVLTVICCGRRNQKQCQQHCHWNIHGIHGDTLTREAGNHRLPLS